MSPAERHGTVGSQLEKDDPDIFAEALRKVVLSMGEAQSSTLSPLKPKGAKSKVWDHFAFYDGWPNEVFCKLCCPPDTEESTWQTRGRLKKSPSGSTKTLRSHLKRIHKIDLDEVEDAAEAASPQKGALPLMTEEAARKIHVQMVKGTNLRCLHPFRLWESEMSLVLKALNQQVPPLSGKTAKKLCMEILEEEQKARKKLLLDNFSEAVPMLSQELDGWPSPRHGKFIGQWLHGISKTWEQISVLSCCEPLEVAETASNVAQRLVASVQEECYSRRTVFFFVCLITQVHELRAANSESKTFARCVS